MSADPSTAVTVHAATTSDRPVLEQLWTMFQHDLSAYTGAFPDHAGRFRQERLDAALGDPDWAGHLLRLGPAPVGLAVIRGLTAPVRTINSFFLVRAARRSGNGLVAVRTITRANPGRWQVAFQDANRPAAAFWRKAADQADENWALEHRPVPNRPDLPADAWITFTVRQAPAGRA